jgi:uroporphyrinogen-III synthase
MDIALTCVDFIKVHDVDFHLAALKPLIYDALVFTSSNAVNSFFRNGNVEPTALKPVYAISGKTKNELLKLGMSPIVVADNAEQLADLIIANGSIKSVLHICGNLALDTLQHRVSTADIGYMQIQVYETVLNSVEINEPFDAIMFYSPSGVESFTIKNEIDTDTLYCCIGLTTAEKLKTVNDKVDIILPTQPTPEAMLIAIRDFKKGKEI